MELTTTERSALTEAIAALEEAAKRCDPESPVGDMLAGRAKRYRELL